MSLLDDTRKIAISRLGDHIVLVYERR